VAIALPAAGDDGKNDNKAKLGPEKAGDGQCVIFDYNPASIVISHTAPMKPSGGKSAKHKGGTDNDGSTSGGTVTGGVDEVAKANGITTIGLRSVTFDGPKVIENCIKLITWTHLKPVPDKKNGQKADLPQLTFVWGKSQTYLVNLNQVTITYTRFTASGRPVRALVDMTLHSIPKIPGPTNPSSGGLAGRRAHLLTGSENLPALAMRTYGSPGHWREIAAANGIEDPLRVRPGTYVYLPSAQEGGE
jgi:hypothetical protein